MARQSRARQCPIGSNCSTDPPPRRFRLQAFTSPRATACINSPRSSFLAPLGYLQLFADEAVGPDHLDLKLPASGETIILSDATGSQIQSVTYGAQTEGVSQGRLPDGNSNITNFPARLSPEHDELPQHLHRTGDQ
jgi:hypothetical protein